MAYLRRDVLFVAGTFGLIRKNETGAVTMVREGVHYYFRVLLPWLAIPFVFVLVFVTITIITMLSTGGSFDYEAMGLLAVVVMIPTLFLTFFCDTAAVFEDLRVFVSLRRSIAVVSCDAREVLGFFVVCFVLSFADRLGSPSSGRVFSLTNSRRLPATTRPSLLPLPRSSG